MRTMRRCDGAMVRRYRISRMINRIFVLALVGVSIAGAAAAQQAAPQAPPTVSGYVRNSYNGNKNNILRTAEKEDKDLVPA